MPHRIMLAKTETEFREALALTLDRIEHQVQETNVNASRISEHLRTLNGRVGKSEADIARHEADLNQAKGAIGIGKWLYGAIAAAMGAAGAFLKDQVAK